ncbi:unnamed protein product [Adineta ricciae]|uniref:Poly [ADP-ribose] polymerase n=1 Tax=Adineta ricciae TaxID=249248 RepID=A0A814EQI0_ADIRI|nr:unnamed protein product [Adineta ricciae]
MLNKKIKAKTAAASKRKAPAAKSAPASKRAKKQVEEEEPEEELEEEEEETKVEEEASSKSDIIKQLREADARKTKAKVHNPDKSIPGAASYQVIADYDAMLNQTNIGANNNKFYVIQALTLGGKFYTWTRWGRVGETGQSQMFGPFGSQDAAVKQFKSKFKDKTKNDWDSRDQFKKIAGKYDLIDVAGDGDDEEEQQTTATKRTTVEDKDGVVYAASKLDTATQSLIRLIFDTDMFKDALKTYDIDVKKMPLGKLSKSQIAKGFEVLEELEAVMENKKKGSYDELSSRFYTAIPHDFGRAKPRPINTREALQQKYDMLAVLADIELAQSIQKNKENEEEAKKKVEQAKPHPYDVNYGLLKCSLEHVDTSSEEFKTIKKYTENTQGYRKCTIIDAWRVGREGEGERFAAHDKIGNRKLLWHGTNVAVVVAILKSGLRIMPHSGGRVGKGIYFASENGKSSGYVGTTHDQGKNIGIMFLNEVALGREHSITADDSSLKKPPANFDSVVARGQTEPDPKDDTSITIEGKKVVVPAGKPIRTEHSSSSFSQSEYLIYQENQCQIGSMMKQTTKLDYSKMSEGELRLLLNKHQQMLSNTRLINTLPDKGERFRNAINEIESFLTQPSSPMDCDMLINQLRDMTMPSEETEFSQESVHVGKSVQNESAKKSNDDFSDEHLNAVKQRIKARKAERDSKNTVTTVKLISFDDAVRLHNEQQKLEEEHLIQQTTARLLGNMSLTTTTFGLPPSTTSNNDLMYRQTARGSDDEDGQKNDELGRDRAEIDSDHESDELDYPEEEGENDDN